jgi:hypothetical protein
MGDLNQPLNTFWQLFFRANGSTRWVDRAASLAIATNGGIVMAPSSAHRRSFTVAVRPANLLVFSPLLGLSASGASWTPLSPLPDLTDAPDVLVVHDPGTSYALTGSGGDALESATDLTTWRNVTTVSALRASPAGRACGLQALTAVGEEAGRVVLGATCTRNGVVGVLAASASGWRLASPAVLPRLDIGTVRVIGLIPTGDGLCAVLAVTHARSTTVVAAWADNGHLRWRVSSPLLLGPANVTSIGPAGSNGLFVLSSATSGPASLHVEGGPGGRWVGLPTPPRGTATAADGNDGSTDALAVNGTDLSDWVLTPGARRWSKEQVTKVVIEFGTST